MLKLHREGHICLPEVRYRPNNPMVNRKKPEKLRDLDETPVECTLNELIPFDIRIVSGTSEENLFNRLIETYHYLGYTHPVGETLKVMVFKGERPIACMGWCSGARQLAMRDKHIGWSRESRTQNLNLITNNTRYLIMPWVNVPHLASHLLGRFARDLPRQWQDRYGHPVYYLETFVQTDRYPGTCYKAANWISLGLTKGHGTKSVTKEMTVPIKEMFVLPLHKRFRKLLSS